MPKNTLAIVASGGGMACAFSAGALFALARKYPALQPHSMIGGSGCTATFGYFLAGQHEDLRQIWLKELSTPEYISFRRVRRICNIDYLVDTLFSQRYPLDTASVLASPTQLFLSTTNVCTGQSRFFSQLDAPLLEIFRASMALPIIYGKRISIGEEYYIDGNLSTSMQDCVDQAVRSGAKKILVIDNSFQSFSIRALYKAWAVLCAPRVAGSVFRVWGRATPVFVAPPGVAVFSIRLPHRHGALATDLELIARTFHAGECAVIDNPELAEFLTNS